MQELWNKFVKIGIVHFMAYPEVIKGEGPILETLEKICRDDFFDVVEITWCKDIQTREKIKKLLETSHLTVTYGAQPRLLINKLNLNSLEPQETKKAIDCIKEGIDEAKFFGAKAVTVLSGPDPGKEKRDEAKKVLINSLKELSNYAKEKELNFVLEIFDREIDKKCLVGPTIEAVEIAKEVRKECRNFGLLIDLSHLPLLNETPREALTIAKDYLVHIHIGNCVMKDRNHPAYGDQHPRFGIESGENDIEQLKEFLKVLFEIGYLKKNISTEDTPPIVSFEVKPLSGESPEVIIANTKRVFKQAWTKL